jgi:flagellar protein FliT
VTVQGPGGDVIACLGQLAATTAHMVQLARARRWEALPEFDARCGDLLQQLRAMHSPELTPGERARLVALSRRIREDQAELKALVQPQFLALRHQVDYFQRVQAQ